MPAPWIIWDMTSMSDLLIELIDGQCFSLSPRSDIQPQEASGAFFFWRAVLWKKTRAEDEKRETWEPLCHHGKPIMRFNFTKYGITMENWTFVV